jgi:phosphopantothenoylcysteine decarboxylase/phosphopantothenate--cysteine ligase
MFKDKHIVVGVCGGIAAYKACYIIRGLIKQGAEVQVVSSDRMELMFIVF